MRPGKPLWDGDHPNLAAAAPRLGRDKAVLFVKDADAFYCPAQ